MSRRSRFKQVEIFNFSFLDVLACTIGLLIFIMVMVFILQSGSPVADTGKIIARKLGDVMTLQAAAARDTQIVEGLEAQFDRVRAPGEPDLTPERETARFSRDVAKARFDAAGRSLAEIQALLDEARLAHDRSLSQSLQHAKADLVAAHQRNDLAQAALAEAIAAANTHTVVLSPYTRPGEPPRVFQVLHVDCHDDGVTLLEEVSDKIAVVGNTAITSLDDPQSDYQRLVAAHRQRDNALVLFWVRPDGGETYSTALEQLPKPTTYGFEPADADWSFQTTAP